MKPLHNYTREMKQISNDASGQKGTGGGVFAWLMMIVGVVVTGTMTYSLTYQGMQSSALWSEWTDVAALFPVVLLEGSALALVYGRHHWFRSSGQRSLANAASWLIWIVLGATSVVHFAYRNAADPTVQWLMQVYASYVLPLTIVAIPMLWKRLYDLAPESQTRIAVLEAEADLRQELVKIQREQNDLMIGAYRESLDTPRVTAARKALFEQASIEHAKEITGFIEGAGDDSHAMQERPRGSNLPRARRYNGEDDSGHYDSH